MGLPCGTDIHSIARASDTEKAEPKCGVDALDVQFEGEMMLLEGAEAKHKSCPDYPFSTGNQYHVI